MKLANYNISPLPFYDDINQQNHRKDYAFGQVFPLVTYKNFLLPFQFYVDVKEDGIEAGGTNLIYSVYLYSLDGTTQIDITNSMLEAGLELAFHNGCANIRYPGLLPITEIKSEGLFYLSIGLYFTEKRLYSEVFCITNTVDNCLLLEYRNSHSFELPKGIIDFSNGFKFKCYLNTQVGKPEYTFEEEVTERMGYSFIESQVSKKLYKFTFLAPEYLCDALRLVRLCDTKIITSERQKFEALTFAMEPDWEEQGDLAAVSCEFETDTLIANVGGYTPVLKGGDFNNDYNNDFNIT